METLTIYDQLHFVCSRLHTGLHVIELQNSDLSKEIMSNEPSEKWIDIAKRLESQTKILNESMSYIISYIRSECVFVNYKSSFCI